MAFREAANYLLRSPESSQDEVLGALRTCGQSCTKITDQNLRGKLYNDLGLHYAQTGLFRLAERYFHEALQLCRQDDVSGQKRAVLLQNLGAVYNALEQFERALSFHSEAADIYGALGASQRTAQAQCLYNLATAHVRLKNYSSAEFYYQQTQKAFAETGDSSGEALTCEALGATHFSQGHLDRAVGYYKQALKLFGKAKVQLCVCLPCLLCLAHQRQVREGGDPIAPGGQGPDSLACCPSAGQNFPVYSKDLLNV
ncbi:tetratricopeptide repeat protein 24 [Pogona vitticeps]